MRAAHELIAHVPQEEVIYLHMERRSAAMEDAYRQLPNLRTLSLSSYNLSLPEVFPNPNLIQEKITLPLENVRLGYVAVDNGDWSPLVTFLVRRASFGNQLDTLTIENPPHMCLEVVERIRGMVRVLEIDIRDSPCPFGTCPEPQSQLVLSPFPR